MRNPPELYLQALQEHFTKAPQWFSPTAEPTKTPENILSASATTNQNGKNTAFQRWFHFKEAFSPAFVSAAIDSLGFRPRHIIDPFGGSGTSALTAQLLSIDATTVEVNPFLCDVIKAKTSHLKADHVRSAELDFKAMLLETPCNLSRLSHWPHTFIESDDKHRWIFPIDVARRLSQYLTCIEAIENEDLQRLFRVILGGVVVDSSNVYVNGKGRRYRSNWKTNQPTAESLDELFNKQFSQTFEDILRFEQRPKTKTNVVNGDSREALAGIDKSADLIVFSPPYPNSFDYTDIYNVELWVLGYLGNANDNRKLRNETLRSHVQIRREYDLPNAHSPNLDHTLEKLEAQKDILWNSDIPSMVGSYFRDLENILIDCLRLLTSNGKVIMVVGDSRYSDVRIDVAKIISELASNIGFNKVTIKEVRQMRSSAQQGGSLQLSESIIELRLL